MKIAKNQNEFSLIVLTISVILVFGLLMVLSASSVMSIEGNEAIFSYLFKQGLGALGGFLLSIIIIRFGNLNIYSRLTHIISYFFAILIIFTAFFGRAAGGNSSWIPIPIIGFNLQASEFAKITTIILLGILIDRGLNDKHHSVAMLFENYKRFISNNQTKRPSSELKRVARRGLFREAFYSYKEIVPILICLFGVIVLQGDLGTGIIYIIIIFGMLLIAGVKKRILIPAVFVGTAFAAFFILISENRRHRILAPILECPNNPLNDICFQGTHSLYAFATGGILGVGAGASKEKWALPAPHNDMIYSIIAEEFGLFGTVAVLLAVVFLTFLIIRVAGQQKNFTSRLIVGGFAIWYFGQSFLNMSIAAMPFMPAFGITLPIISYGPNSLISTFVSFAVVLSFAKPTLQKKVEENKIKKRKAGTIEVNAGKYRR